VPSRIAQQVGSAGGALVLSVKPGSLAEEAGLVGYEQGVVDIIVAANGKKIDSAQDLLDLVKALKSGEAVVLKFIRATRSTGGPMSTTTQYTSITKP
jgi:S1-C subfamily serine protease